jgi:hypothetical protein
MFSTNLVLTSAGICLASLLVGLTVARVDVFSGYLSSNNCKAVRIRAPMSARVNVRVIRRAQWFGKYKKMRVYINNAFIGSVKNGGCFEYHLPDGVHTISVTMDWCRSENTGFLIDVIRPRITFIAELPVRQMLNGSLGVVTQWSDTYRLTRVYDETEAQMPAVSLSR